MASRSPCVSGLDHNHDPPRRYDAFPTLRGMSRCLLLKARHRANPSAQWKRFASLLLTPFRASSAVCSVASPPGRGSRHRRAPVYAAPSQPSLHALRPKTMRNAAFMCPFPFSVPTSLRPGSGTSTPPITHNAPRTASCPP